MFVFIIACGGGEEGGSMLCMSYHLLIRTTLLWDGLFSHYRARCSYNIMHKNLLYHIFLYSEVSVRRFTIDVIEAWLPPSTSHALDDHGF